MITGDPVHALRSGVRTGTADVAARERPADDSGFTPAEIIIGVILLAILSTSVVAQALELRQQAQDAAAQTTLRSAVAAARGAYSLTLPGGQNNFIAMANMGNLSVDSAVQAAAVATLSLQEPNINFVTYASQAAAMTALASTNTGVLSYMSPSTTTVWVHMPGTELSTSAQVSVSGTNPNKLTVGLLGTIAAKTKIRAGNLIRLGIVGASGSSFCAILVADSSNGTVSGIGYQSVDEAATIGKNGADCGAAETGDNQFKEMPGTIGTDPSLSRPLPAGIGDVPTYGGNNTAA